jgi:hypothetical protein
VKRLTVLVVLPLLVLAGCGFAVWQVAGETGRSGTLGSPATPSSSAGSSPSSSPGAHVAP